ncbi:glycosyltransferase family 4 protein [Xenorhabdus littoralis]|uniref:glycosyltransferase family 4 protein n=1 Tax=Xenorhabdus littoralis TaxID=2582835 RepID=UPI0029E7EB5B|nr:glycosyltransferase family 4 protein [Xenorhabdus sp. psl]MDX7992001.1 glycosyltransferase family 4 protein [Xenorhabdus sp. psl]
MKIIFVITKADEIGGAQTHVKDIANKMKQDGHQVTVIVGEKGALVSALNTLNIDVIILPSLVREISLYKDINCIYQLRRYINKLSPDIVTLHSSKAGIVGRLSLILTNIPVIFTAHGWAFADGVSEKKKRLYILIERLFSRLADKIITVSHQDKELALKYKVSPNDKQVVIHNGIPDISISHRPIKDVKNDKVINLISVARFSDQKDHETLLKSLSLLNNRNWTLSLVGKGPLFNRTKELSRKLKLENNILFLGERNDVDELLEKSDIFILSSNWEGLPISIIEAMRHSLPVIASNVGGVKELIDDNINGFLVERKNSNQLKEKIQYLIDNESIRTEFGFKSRKKYINNFSFEEMYNKTIKLYTSLIKGK